MQRKKGPAKALVEFGDLTLSSGTAWDAVAEKCHLEFNVLGHFCNRSAITTGPVHIRTIHYMYYELVSYV